MRFSRFRTEDELLRSVLHSLPYDAYPKVSVIGGRRIAPDIDILQIQKVSQAQSRLVGYEIKLVKFDKRSKGLSWSSFYSGIGQALLYLKNGVHRATLVLGFHEGVPDDRLIDDFYHSLWDNKDLLKQILGDHVSVSIYLYEGGSVSSLIEASCDFYPPSQEGQLLVTEMLQGKFTFNRRLRSD
jgi:hypothetical protein